MPHKTYEGRLDARGFKFAILVARFNSFVTDRLLQGALDALDRSGCRGEDLHEFAAIHPIAATLRVLLFDGSVTC